MDTIYSIHRKLARMLANILSIVVILAMAFPATIIVSAAAGSPFVGRWQATDTDGSDIRLSIAGPPDGPYQITWTESYISFCGGGPGIVRGMGWLNEEDANLLEADLHVECFTTGASLDFHLVWRYHPVSNKLSSRDGNGVVTIWHRPGGGQLEEPPALGLRVNYGHDWVESFYEGDHTAWVTVTDGDGNLKATVELFTEPKEYWGDETGFQSLDGIWFDADGNQMEYPPDIQPNDWVYGWVDNGASSQVQIGDISGTIDLENDSISGTINASWFSDPVQVECLDWGSGQDPSFDNQDGGFILTNGEDPYSCSWEGWDIQPGQNVGVGYSGPDGHWVANAFYEPATIIVSSANDVIADDGVCTLREAVIAANTNSPSGVMEGECVGGLDFDADTILLVADQTYSLSIDSTYEDDAWDGDLDIWDNSADKDLIVMVEGGGNAKISQDATVDDRVLQNHGATVRIEGLILTGGGDVDIGGGAWNFGTLTLDASTITGNASNDHGGGFTNEGTATIQNGSEISGNSAVNGGGGVYNTETGTLTVVDSAISGNTAGWGGGIVTTGTLIISEGSVSNNATIYTGGGIQNTGNLTLTNSTVSSNSSSESGGGVFNDGGTLTVDGGAISNNTAADSCGGLLNGGTAALTNATISGNTASWNAGGICNSDGSSLIVNNSTISGNVGTGDGGGVFNNGTMEMFASEVSGNSAGWGGGLNNMWGTLTIHSSTVSNNTVTETGGGIANWGGMLTVNASTISDNSAPSAGGLQNYGDGNAMLTNTILSGNSVSWIGGGIVNDSTLTLDAVTVSGNHADADGGGIFSWSTLTIKNGSQVTDNTAGGGGGGIVNSGGTLDVQNSTIARNSAGGPGGIANWSGGIATLMSATIAENSTGWAGGGIENWGTMSIDASTISGNSSDVFGGGIMNSSDLTLTNSTITGNISVHGGGGINNEGKLTITNSTLSANSDGQGGALYNSGTAGITEVYVENNTASDGGGGLFNIGTMSVESSTVFGNWAPYGGGLFNWIGGVLTIDNTTISNNSANEGGGLHNKEGSTTVVKNNSVFSGNYAAFTGGGLQNWGTLIVTESVLLGNTSPGEGDAIISSVDVENATSIIGSCIVGNGDTAVFNSLSTFQNFTGNWWGDASGPSGFGPGSGDSVSDYVEYSNWLTEAPSICAP